MKKRTPKLSRRTLKKAVWTLRLVSWSSFIAAILLTRMELTFENFMMTGALLFISFVSYLLKVGAKTKIEFLDIEEGKEGPWWYAPFTPWWQGGL
jgi:hypothetical protein